MSKAQRLARLKEIIRELIKKNLAEVSTTATAGIRTMSHYKNSCQAQAQLW